MIQSPLTQQMSTTRRKVLQLLKVRGPSKAEELGRALDITATGVRQHLAGLERAGLVSYTTEKRGRGRPSYLYALTEAGDELFPRSYPQLANALLDAARAAFGAEGLRRIFQERNEAMLAHYRAHLRGQDLGAKVARLATLRGEEGYMADWERQDEHTFLLREHNCAICQVARRCQEACRRELELFRRALPEARVERKEHMLQGDRACTYVIRLDF